VDRGEAGRVSALLGAGANHKKSKQLPAIQQQGHP
jgi:hypothetical protein